MTYLKWNNIIGDYFFGDIENQGKTIFLYLNKEILLRLASRATGNKNDEDLWKDFIQVINNPIIETEECGVTRFSAEDLSYTSRLRKLIGWARVNHIEERNKYPVYLCFLLMPIIAKAEKETESDANVRNAVNAFFGENNIIFSQDDFSNRRSDDIFYFFCENQKGDCDGGLWKSLAEWSKKNDRGVNYFNFNPKGKQYVNMVSDQCLLTKNDIIHVRELYDKAELNANDIYNYLDFKAHLLRQKKNFKYYFKNETAKLLKSNSKKGDRLFHVLFSDFNNWDGYFETVDSDSSKTWNVHTHYIYVCVSVNENEGTFKKEYRLHEDITSPLSVEYSDGTKDIISLDHNGWSTVLHSKDVKAVTSEHQRNIFKFNASYKDVYLLDRDDVIPGIVLVHHNELIYEGTYCLFFIAKDRIEDVPKITDMGLHNDEGYHLYRYDNVEKNDDIIVNGILKDFISVEENDGNCNFHIKGGLPILALKKSKGYMNSFFPLIYGNADRLSMINTESDERIELNRIAHNDYEEDVWQIPDNINGGTYKIGDSSLQLTILSRNELFKPSVDYIVRNGQGNKICLSSELSATIEGKYINDNKISVPGIQEFNTAAICKVRNATIKKSNDSFEPKFGDILIDWLYWCGECPKEQFKEGYVALQHAQEESDHELAKLANKNNWYTALRWLIKEGYVEYDNDRKKVIPLSPRLILLPVESNQCNKMRLVGCRSMELIKSLQNECKKHDFLGIHIFYASDSNMQERLTPTSIFIDVKGNENDEYGLDSVDKYICECIDIEKPQRNYLPSLWSLIPKPFDLKKENWIDVNLNNYSDIERCYIFNEESMTYSKTPNRFVDIPNKIEDFALARIERRNHTYDYALFNKSENKYLCVEDEALGKLFLESSHSHSGVITRLIKVIRTGYDCNIEVAKRMDMPIPLARYLNFISTKTRVEWNDKEQLNYYVYSVRRGIDISFLVRMIEDITTLTLTKINK